MKKLLSVTILSVALVIMGTVPLFCQTFEVNPSGSSNGSGPSFVPRGEEVVMLRFSLRARNGNATFSQLGIENTSSDVFFGHGVTKVKLYKGNGTGFATTLPSLTEQVFSGAQVGVTSLSGFSDTVTSGDVHEYFVTYTVDKDAKLTVDSAGTPSTTNFTIRSVNSGSLPEISLSGIISSTPKLEGFVTTIAKSYMPAVVVPGQTKIPVLALSIKAIGQDLEQNINIVFKNAAGNFVSGNAKGITRAFLLKDSSGSSFVFSNGTAAQLDTFIAANDGTSSMLGNTGASGGSDIGIFSSKNTLTFMPSASTFRFPAATSINMLLVYEVGSDFVVSSNSVINGQFTLVTAKDNDSQTVQRADALPSSPSEAGVAGLTYTSLSKIFTDNWGYGYGAKVPMLQFSLIAYKADVKLSQLDINNPTLDPSNPLNTIPFITGENDLTGIRKIYIYTDGGTPNGSFDGVNSQDTLIGQLDLGKGNNTSTEAFIPISIDSNGTPLTVTSLNVNETNSLKDHRKRIYVVYELGRQITAGKKFSAQLANTVGFAFTDPVTTKNINLSGTKPAAPTPAAQIEAKDTNITLQSVVSIAPSPNLVIQGQTKVPMLSIEAEVFQAFPSASFQIVNGGGTFVQDGKGVKRIWVYLDNPPYGQYTSADEFQSFSDISTSTTLATLTGIKMDTGTLKRYLILYDIGQNVPAASQGVDMRAQLRTISGKSKGITVVVSGEKDIPGTPAIVKSQNRNMGIQLGTNSFNTSLIQTADQDLTLIFRNNSGQSVTIQKLIPRFYYGGINGQDVSYEFTILSRATPNTMVVPSGQTLEWPYSIRFVKPEYEGTIVMDGFAQYINASNNVGVVSRYQSNTSGSEWQSAADSTVSIPVNSVIKTYSWTIPQYVQNMKGVIGTTEVPFYNGGALPYNCDKFVMTFGSRIRALDTNSFVVKLNGVQLSSVSSNSSTAGFKYVSENRALEVYRLGTSSGSLSVQVKDIEGVLLNPLSLTFTMTQDKASVTDFLVFPSPYRIGATFLMGFNVTQPGVVTFYLYNHQGVQIWKGSAQVLTAGYQLFASRTDSSLTLQTNTDTNTLADLPNLLSSGSYICRLVYVDSKGNSTRATTRFAVY